jgi:hypothetical protein
VRLAVEGLGQAADVEEAGQVEGVKPKSLTVRILLFRLLRMIRTASVVRPTCAATWAPDGAERQR